jgi:prepilin peptidase CpaA
MPVALLVPWLLIAQGFGITGFPGTALGMLLFLVDATVTLTDLWWHRIYNWTTYTALVWTVLFNLGAVLLPEGVPFPGWGQSAEAPARSLRDAIGSSGLGEMFFGLLVCLGIMFVVFCIFRGGAGDVKLMAVLGAILGVQRGLDTLIYGYVLAAIFAVCYLVWNIGPGGILGLLLQCLGLVRWASWFGGDKPPDLPALFRQKVPMGPFLAAGSLVAVFWN